MARLIKLLLTLFIVLYPICVYVGLQFFELRYLGLLLLVVVAGRFINQKSKTSFPALAMAIFGGMIALAVLISDQEIFLRIYPVCMSLVMLVLFGYSVINPPSIIENFARIRVAGPLPDYVIRYTRNVTLLWCGFFVLNAAVASYTVFASREIWTLYNGLISYLLMGGLFIGELLYRKWRLGGKHEIS